MTKEKSILKTHLNRSIVMYAIAVVTVFVFYLWNSTISMLVMFILIFLLFLRFLFSKEIFEITFDDAHVTFVYLRFIKKSATFRKDEIIGKKRVDVKFRGGRNEILELYYKKSNKKLFEINKKLFEDKNDFDFLKNIFSR